jgi:hypothetical protein
MEAPERTEDEYRIAFSTTAKAVWSRRCPKSNPT